MAKNSTMESHLSERGGKEETPPIKQHHRMAMGEKANGQSNPYGAERGSTDSKLAGNTKNY